MSYDLLQNLIVALIVIGALLYLLDHFAPSLRRHFSRTLQQQASTAALGRWLEPRGGDGHCGSNDDGCNSCESGCSTSTQSNRDERNL